MGILHSSGLIGSITGARKTAGNATDKVGVGADTMDVEILAAANVGASGILGNATLLE